MKARTIIPIGIGVLVIALGVWALLPNIDNRPGICELLPWLVVRKETPDLGRANVQNLSMGLAAFKSDFAVYPPSRWTNEPDCYKATGGAGLLAYHLMGPERRGWGKGAGGRLSLTASGTSARQLGPYFQVETGSQPTGLPGPMLDNFRPGKPILYFRAEPGREPLFDVADNPADPTGQAGFASQEQFEMLAKYKGADGQMHWRRTDYLLISPGPDRVYGYVVPDKQTGKLRPARPEERDQATCDDVTNFDF